MKFLLDYDFTNEEIEDFSANVPSLLLEGIFNNYRLVSQNLDTLRKMGVHNFKKVFIKFYDMFLMDSSNFTSVFSKYDREDLVEKIIKNEEIVEFL